MLIDFNQEEGYIKIKNQDDVKYYNFKFEEKQGYRNFCKPYIIFKEEKWKIWLC